MVQYQPQIAPLPISDVPLAVVLSEGATFNLSCTLFSRCCVFVLLSCVVCSSCGWRCNSFDVLPFVQSMLFLPLSVVQFNRLFAPCSASVAVQCFGYSCFNGAISATNCPFIFCVVSCVGSLCGVPVPLSQWCNLNDLLPLVQSLLYVGLALALQPPRPIKAKNYFWGSQGVSPL